MNRDRELLENTIGYLCELIHDDAEYLRVLAHLGFNSEEIDAEKYNLGYEEQ